LVQRDIITIAQAFEVMGIDVSKWNDGMNFVVTESRGIEFVYIRAGFGAGTIDEQLEANRTKIAGTTGMDYGVYWFCYIGSTNAVTAATSFYNAWKNGKGQLPPVADLEITTLTPLATTAWVWQFTQTFESLSGVELMYYTAPGWANANLVVSSVYPIYNRKLWDAHWTTAAFPIIPNVWSTKGKGCTFWQYSANGNKLGVFYGAPPPPAATVDMDLDKYNGTAAQYHAEFPGTVPPPPPPPPPIEELKMVNLAFLDSFIDITVPAGELLSGSSVIAVTIPNIPVGATGVIFRFVLTGTALDGYVSYGTGATGNQLRHYAARVNVPSPNLNGPYIERTAFVTLKDGKIWREHDARGGTLKYWVKVIGWMFPASVVSSDVNDRLDALEGFQADAITRLDAVKTALDS
jgi:GH25 family lysozyme M1 (1,4-beta-N-acetylmuramidase)